MSTDNRVFDRTVKFDERSRNYPIRAVIAQKTFRSYTWRCNQWNDQGHEGKCVGYAWSHEISARPVEVIVGSDIADKIYKRAQQIDEWAGENYEGTSVLAGVKATKELGYIGEYRWGFGLDDLRMAVAYKGPTVLGVNWYTGMYNTDPNGFLHVTGQRVGGHAILCNGVNEKGKFFRLHNSWGQTWGKNGEAFISFDDMNKLLHEKGEVCVPVKRLKPNAK